MNTAPVEYLNARALGPPREFLDFLKNETDVAPPPLCPEVRLHTARDLPSLWAAQEAHMSRRASSAPYWSVAWPGGQALARFVLDHPERVRDRTVLDVGSGSGIGAIAAAQAGARRIVAADIDALAGWAIAANAEVNGVRVDIVTRDVIGEPTPWDVILAGDLWYDRFLAMRVTPWLRGLAAQGSLALLGDVGRAYFPRAGLVERAVYAVAAPESLERSALIEARVWEFRRVDAAS